MVFFPLIPQLLHKRVVMARTAPRHLNLLRNAGPRFQVVPSRFKGQLSKASFPTPYAYAMETAKQKTLEVARRMHQKHGKDAKDADCTATVESLPPTAIVKMIYGLKVSQVLFTACKMKVFDLLRDEGPLRAEDIARKTGASEIGTGQLLDACVALGLLDKTERGKGTGRSFSESHRGRSKSPRERGLGAEAGSPGPTVPLSSEPGRSPDGGTEDGGEKGEGVSGCQHTRT
ncbi:probable bifunctional dTTP/UTP pyrophosphatase/methyltransferase protein [Artibeus jamaicensis]|uniref:probable bifunctional dTTP/UTP pyrophosphatase/methyltransferase protein n=1 Tax=Artibeus jamaicensis TaxID=9417 RepID=UPI00235AFEC9|nr:probable bifunctional dTTP/UTP pyrophosphatase/methyltransferase protein [Artibeus jamaicensis]